MNEEIHFYQYTIQCSVLIKLTRLLKLIDGLTCLTRTVATRANVGQLSKSMQPPLHLEY